MSDLRDYQRQALDALYDGWVAGGRRLGVSLPTGVGKTRIMCHVGRREVEAGGPPVLYLLHRDTLVEQTAATLRATCPGASVGVVKARRDEVGARLIVASVHTLRSEARRRRLPRVGKVVVDEAHVSVSRTYRDVYEHVGAFREGGADLAGFSATWSRSDGAGLGDVWERVVFRRSIEWAVERGHLVRPRGVQVGDGLDLAGVPVSRATGDYRDEDLGPAVMLEELRDLVVRAALRFGAGRPGVLFAPTVASAEYFGDALRAAGVPAAGIYHDVGPHERARRFADHRAGRLAVLTTVTALAEGWDCPPASVGYMLRPTRHQGRFVQEVGRLLRPWPGKDGALVLDFVGLLDDLDLRSAVCLDRTSFAVRDDAGDLGLVEPPEEAEEERGSDGRVVRRRRQSREVELFAGTRVLWQRTDRGVPFVGCGDRLVFVVAVGDGWSVGECPSYTAEGGRWLAEGLEAADALEVAAERAEEAGGAVSRRSARWRGAAPSAAQLSLARDLGVPEALDPRATRGELSAAIDRAQASRTLRRVAEWAEALEAAGAAS